MSRKIRARRKKVRRVSDVKEKCGGKWRRYWGIGRLAARKKSYSSELHAGKQGEERARGFHLEMPSPARYALHVRNLSNLRNLRIASGRIP